MRARSRKRRSCLPASGLPGLGIDRRGVPCTGDLENAHASQPELADIPFGRGVDRRPAEPERFTFVVDAARWPNRRPVVRRGNRRGAAFDRPNNSMPFIAVIGPSRRPRGTGTISPYPRVVKFIKVKHSRSGAFWRRLLHRREAKNLGDDQRRTRCSSDSCISVRDSSSDRP